MIMKECCDEKWALLVLVCAAPCGKMRMKFATEVTIWLG